MNIAVVGGGIFGVTSAILASREGHTVSIYEKGTDILGGASLTNQFRLHRGYHYPRSRETIAHCLSANAAFLAEYQDAVIDDHTSYYCIAKENTLSSAEHCATVWNEFGLDFEQDSLDLVNVDKMEKIFRVKESLLDYAKLKDICWNRLHENHIKVHLNTEANPSHLARHHFVIVATYTSNNRFLDAYPEKKQDYQYELCEKPLLALPPKYKGKSIVVMDGPFMCIDPYGKTGYHLMGNVVHAIHSTNVGKFPIIPPQFKSLLDKGIIAEPPVTNIQKLLASAEEFFPGISREARHVGSKYTFRAVLPNREADDGRPTIVKKINENMVTVFSGKIPTCVDAAQQIISILKGVEPLTHLQQTRETVQKPF